MPEKNNDKGKHFKGRNHALLLNRGIFFSSLWVADSDRVAGRENGRNEAFYGEIREDLSLMFPMSQGISPAFLLPKLLSNPVVNCLVCRTAEISRVIR